MKNIRNFCIIAHIDHGKSTLADRLLELTASEKSRSTTAQQLDSMDLERERGITIKLTPVRMTRKNHELNLIDTPGHVDFSYEVSRSLAAVEGALLVVDASQGVQAQTLAVLNQAIDQWLDIIPVLNKIDLPAANPARVAAELKNILGVDDHEILKVSAKTGLNVEQILDAVIDKISPPDEVYQNFPKKFRKPEADRENFHAHENPARALIFDSVFDNYKGVVTYLKVLSGTLRAGQEIQLLHSDHRATLTEVWFFSPKPTADSTLDAGQIGYLLSGEKNVRNFLVGDTILLATREKKSKDFALPGFKKAKPFVFAGVYPIATDDYLKLKTAIEKLALNDSAIQFSQEESKALGFGFRVGFLGLLHMDIIKERLSREYDLDTIFTSPSVIYLVKSKNFKHPDQQNGQNITDLRSEWRDSHLSKILGKPRENLSDDDLHPRLIIKSGADMIEQGSVDQIFEPVADLEVVGPDEFAGAVMDLCQEHRGILEKMDYLDQERVLRRYKMPLNEIIVDFYDKLKSLSKGYASMNYEISHYEKSDLVKLDIIINNERVEAFSRLVHKSKSFYFGRALCEKLKELIPKHLFAIPVQAAVGTKILARETISAIRKDVIAKCYGWDVSRKRKLLQKQKEGKKKMKMLGNVSLPGDIFIKIVGRE